MSEIIPTGITVNYQLLPSKKDIIRRLFEAGHIDFNEMWVLLQDEPEVKYVPMMPDNPPIVTPWPYPNYPWDPPYYPTVSQYDQSNKGVHFSRGGEGNPDPH